MTGFDPVTQCCRTCGALVFWANTSRGKYIPIDAAPCSDGNLVIVAETDGRLWALTQADLLTPMDQGPFYKSHFATCPQANEHRRKQ